MLKEGDEVIKSNPEVISVCGMVFRFVASEGRTIKRVNGHEIMFEGDNSLWFYEADFELKNTTQDRPTRYKSREVNGMDVIDLIKHWDLDFCDGNILKYLLRQKGEDLQDMEKIKDYAYRKIKQLKK